ncbi:hypothetical protein BDZ97DRAFT_1912062 [Flammula alnicola]|nr:hypothetical protein BDZ97DRAFT_1912062 [Flammula alnicola]
MHIFSLYRSYLRQVRLLPHLYLRQFFQVRARNDIQAILDTKEEIRQTRKIKNISKRVQRLEKANNRDIKSFLRILNLAYGRTGKLKWELLEHTSAPTYNPQRPALPTSHLLPRAQKAPHNSLTKGQESLAPRHLHHPAHNAPRADPNSDDAKLFGPFSKRREVNIRWRWYKSELKKVLPPLEVEVKGSESALDELNKEGQFYPRPLAMQGLGVFQDAESVIGDTLFPRQPLTRRERRMASRDDLQQSQQVPNRHPSRWVRRRYRTLLASLPQLVYDPDAQNENLFRVNTSSLALTTTHKGTRYDPPADETTLAWIQPSSTRSIK